MGDKDLGTADRKKMGIGVRSRKRSRGQNWLMGELGEKKVKSLVLGVMGPNQLEILRSRLCSKKTWGQEGEGFCVDVADVGSRRERLKGQTWRTRTH